MQTITTLSSDPWAYVNPFGRDLSDAFDKWMVEYGRPLSQPITSFVDLNYFRCRLDLDTLESDEYESFHHAYTQTIVDFQKKHGWYIGMVEGLHRAYASLCAMTGSFIDCVNEPVVAPMTLRDDHMIAALDPLKTKFDLDREDIDLLKVIETKISSESGVLGAKLSVFPRVPNGVKNTSAFSAAAVLEELNNESLAWQTDKKNSSYRPASVCIGEFFEFVYDRVRNKPDRHNRTGCGKWRFHIDKKDSSGEWVMPEPDIFKEAFYQDFLQSPSKEKYTRVADKMKEPNMDMSNKEIALPYGIAFQNMIESEIGFPNTVRKNPSSSFADAMEVNNLLNAPCIYEPIYKAFFNRTEFDAAGQKRLKFLLHYFIRTVQPRVPSIENAAKYDVVKFRDRGECLDDIFAALFVLRALNACLADFGLFPIAIKAFEQAEHASYGESQKDVFSQYGTYFYVYDFVTVLL